MLLKVFLCVLQIVLRLGRDHAGQSAKTPLSCCAAHCTTSPAKIVLLAGMNTNQTTFPNPKPGEQLWGIYFTDRQYAREMGDPLRAVVAAPTKIAAEEAAIRLGMDAPWAHPLTAEQTKSIRESATRPPEQPRITMQPTTAELRTAIEVLKVLDQRLNDHAAHSVMQLPNTDLGDQYAEQFQARTIEQTSHIEKVSMQLQNWRDELLQQRKLQVAQSV
jgi:hypothetical protein